MKIRTDFVTNSSSYSSVCISIQSKELADLLKKYKASRELRQLSVRGSRVSVYEDEVADGWAGVPETLDELIDALISGMQRQAGSGLSALYQEMQEKKTELTASVQSAKWDFQDDSYGEFEAGDEDREGHFFYKRPEDGTEADPKNDSEQKKEESQVPFDAVDSIVFSGKTFVLSGRLAHDREATAKWIAEKGGRCTKNVSRRTNYLVVGLYGNLGAKILEQVMELKSNGTELYIIQERELFAALDAADHPDAARN